MRAKLIAEMGVDNYYLVIDSLTNASHDWRESARDSIRYGHEYEAGIAAKRVYSLERLLSTIAYPNTLDVFEE